MNDLAMLNNPTGLLVLATILLLLFGGNRIPEMMRGFGVGMREFKHGLNEIREDEATERPLREASK